MGWAGQGVDARGVPMDQWMLELLWSLASWQKSKGVGCLHITKGFQSLYTLA